jgi:hypothetical protein
MAEHLFYPTGKGVTMWPRCSSSWNISSLCERPAALIVHSSVDESTEPGVVDVDGRGLSARSVRVPPPQALPFQDDARFPAAPRLRIWRSGSLAGCDLCRLRSDVGVLGRLPRPGVVMGEVVDGSAAGCPAGPLPQVCGCPHHRVVRTIGVHSRACCPLSDGRARAAGVRKSAVVGRRPLRCPATYRSQPVRPDLRTALSAAHPAAHP